MSTSFSLSSLFVSLTMVLMITHGAMGLEFQAAYVRLLQSLLPTQPALLQHTARRLQQQRSSLSEYPFEVLNNINKSECGISAFGAVCIPSERILLTDASPAPDSDAGRMLLKLSALSYQCGAHKSASQCTSNNCELLDVQGGGVNNSTMVQVCWPGAQTVFNDLMEYGLCPGSMAEKIFTCMGMKDGSFLTADDFTSLSCTSRGGVQCQSMNSVCVPVDIKDRYDLNTNAGLEKLQREMEGFSEKFWGCCSGTKMFQEGYACTKQTSSGACSANGKCLWEASIDMCVSNPNSGVFADALLGLQTPLGDFYSKAHSKCKQITDPKTCLSQPSVTNINQTKVSQYAKLDVSAGGETAGCKGGSANAANAAMPTGGRLQGVMAAGMAVLVAAGLVMSGL